MSFKTITISEDAYELLKANKKPNESFSDVVKRSFKKPSSSFLDFVGILPKESVDEIERAITASKKENIKLSKARSEEMAEALGYASRHDRNN